MTWTYDPTLATDLAKVRLYIGDTIKDKPMLSDEEIGVALTAYPSNLYSAAVESVDYILAKIAKDPDRDGSGVGATRSQITEQYRSLREELEEKAASYTTPYTTTYATPIATGYDESARATDAADTNLTQPIFTRDRGVYR